VSCRASVGTGTGVAIAGFVVTGQPGSFATVLVRAVGPALAQFGLTGVLSQPVLTLLDTSGGQVASNTGWGANPNAADVMAAFASAGAFPLAPGGADSALLITLAPGSYTAVVSGLHGGTGIALIEVYNVSPPAMAQPALPVPPPMTTPGAGTG